MKKFIVTDPCYLINDDTNTVWGKFCDLWFEDKFDEAEEVISNEVGTKVSISETGFGDWTNHLYGHGVIESEFGADAGLVSVCELTESIENTLKEKYHCVIGAVFEADGVDDIEFDCSNPNWTVVRIRTTGGFVIESEGCDDEEDEENYWDTDEEDDDDWEDEDEEEDDDEDNEDRR